MSENISVDFYSKLASTFSNEKLELIETICWVLTHRGSSLDELRYSCKEEWMKRRGPAKLTQAPPIEEDWKH
jgi:hypothetical protein